MSYKVEEIDVVQRLKMIEKLKSAMLSKVADLFYCMSDSENGGGSSTQILAEITMLSYMLANRMGSPYEVIDLKLLDKLKNELKNSEEDEWGELISSLTTYLLGRKNECTTNGK
ncbi:MAG: hypothetical protein K0R15_2925 [Clostridiales bacterium]|jgi:hypothetical protein|nr:hypothetical protein [Clostridiales bacterium]